MTSEKSDKTLSNRSQQLTAVLFEIHGQKQLRQQHLDRKLDNTTNGMLVKLRNDIIQQVAATKAYLTIKEQRNFS